MKINLRESLGKIDLETDNKYDLRNLYDASKLSDDGKKKLAEAINNNSITSINRILHESDDQLFKVVIQSGATKRDFESALYEDEAEEVVDYYGGRWIDENGFEWNMYVEEDDESTEHAYEESLNESDGHKIEGPIKLDDETFNRMVRDNHLLLDLKDSDFTEVKDFFTKIGYKNKAVAVNDLWHGSNLGETRSYYEEILDKYLNESLNESADPVIRTFSRDSREFANLKKAAEFLTQLSPTGVVYRVRQTYFDYGQDWLWTTIIAYRSANDSWQAINPKEQGDIIFADSDEEIENIAKNILRESRLDKGFNESLNEASYGGVYDIEDDMYFTKEDIVEFTDNICEDLAKEFGYKYDIADVYMDSPTKLHIELIDNHDVEVDINVRIDMRRIKKPSDLEKAYHNSTLESFKNRFLEEYQYYEFDESLTEDFIKKYNLPDYEESIGYKFRLPQSVTLSGEWIDRVWDDGIPVLNYYEKNPKYLNYTRFAKGRPFYFNPDYYKIYIPYKNGWFSTDSSDLTDELGVDEDWLYNQINIDESLNEDVSKPDFVVGFYAGPVDDETLELVNPKKILQVGISADELRARYGKTTDKLLNDYTSQTVDKLKNGNSTLKAMILNVAEKKARETEGLDDEFRNEERKFLDTGIYMESRLEEINYPFEDGIKNLSKKLGKLLLPKKESLKEDLSDLDLVLNTPADTKQFNEETFRVLKNLVSEYKKDLSGLDQWAMEHEKELFVKKWYKLADKCQEIAKNGTRGITGYGRLNDFVKLKVVDLAKSVDNTFPWYTRNNLAKFNKLESLQEKLNNIEKHDIIKAIVNGEEDDLQTIVDEIYFYDRALYLKLRHFAKKDSLNDKKDYLIKVLQDSLEESLTEDTVKQNGKWVNKGDTGETHGKFKTKKAADQQRKAMFARGFKSESLKESYLYEPQPYSVEDFYNAVDELGYSPAVEYGSGIEYGKVFADDSTLRQLQKELMTEYDLNYDIIEDDDYAESLKEAIDDEIDLDYETDFDDGSVEEGNNFFEDGTEWVWIERIAGPIHLDFDNWAVWSAREYVNPEEFITIHDDENGYDFNSEAYKKKAMAAPVNYFVVDEDTGFIDWGPVENQIEAQDFLNGKVEDWENS